MKLMKTYFKSLIFSLFFLLAVIVGLYQLKPDLLIEFAEINWLALILGIFIVFTRWGHVKLYGNKEVDERLPIKGWLSRIVGLQLSLALVYFGLAHLTGVITPTLTGIHSHIFSTELRYTLFHFGLFPWGLVAVFSLAFGIACYREKRDSYMSTVCLNSAIGRNKLVAAAANTVARAGTFMLIGISVLTATCLLASLMTGSQSLQRITGLNPVSLMVTFLIFFIIVRRGSNHIMKSLVKQQPIAGILLNCLLWAIIISVASLISPMMGSGQVTVPAMLSAMIAKGWLFHWRLLSQAFWFTCVPISAIIIARISIGYSLRELVLGVLAAPAATAVFFLVMQLGHHKVTVHLPEQVDSLLGILGVIFLMSMLFNKKNFVLSCRAQLPKPSNRRRRSPIAFQYRWKSICGVIFYLFVPSGIYLLAVFLSLYVLPAMLVAVGVMLRITFYLSKNRGLKKIENIS